MSTNETPRRPLSLKAKPAEATRIEERLHKVLAQAGLGSRRALEQRIADGKVSVNGEPARTGMSVTGGDKIEIDGKTFVASALTEPARVLMYNKPEGEVTTREDPEGRPTIFDTLPALKGARWIAVGRLDINTTGLLLLTTDGELANAMMHPSHEVEREYVCRVRAPEGEENVSDKLVDRLARGVALEDGPAKFDEIERIGGSNMPEESRHDWFRVLLKEGRNREVRRLWESQGCQVSRLKRIRHGQVRLPQPLLRGHAQELPQAEVDALRKSLGLEDGTPSALTLMPVLGQRKANKTVVTGGARGHGYVGGHSTADEGRELRRFDSVREDRGRRGNRKPSGGLTVSGEQAANQANKRLKVKGPRQPGQRLKPGEKRGENPAAMRTWFVPDGVDTGPSGHRNPGGRGPKKYTPRGAQPAAGDARPQRPARPYGHPGNAPYFPSDHVHGSTGQPGTPRTGAPRGPRSPRPGGGPRPGATPRPGGAPRPRGPGPRGPRGDSR
ncbi:MAG: rRNA pseudouridine synthase [Thermomonas sp.]|uniref:pseudouridine synthase n=1 Tax=Thermomonas sp. TaxID=1971895 RepID=UPI00260444E2|nr:pseudouridine synthase [Thermomonas sp.]MCC7097714.1 rRNA pseudouridine synthase [Thermomonas sp.]